MVAQHREPFDRPEAQCLVATARIELQRAERFGRLHAAIAERTESPKGHKPRFAAALNLPLEFFHARSRLPEVIGRQIDLDRCDAHPRIVGIERVEHQVEEPLGIFEMAAPGSEVPANQAQGEVRLFDSQSEQDRKTTRLNSSHSYISYAVFCSTRNTI